ncbi:M48 family metallopeptidase [Vampirovibrio sp.]|uniref:M48 family metallopeptidase n=1 Tax=Vampirovibrio sp. TaxID=2717857 RepID=UPI0035945881
MQALHVLIEESRKLRRASACIRDGKTIHIKLPRHWSKDLKHSVTAELVERLQKKDAKERYLLEQAAQQPTVTISTNAELETWVQQINQETFRVKLGKVQIGYAKYNHLAQVNLRTKTMTVSRYCLNQAPQEALRYLIIHELAHYFESGHGPRFWALVGQHVPDYRLQSKIMKAFHHQAVIHEEKKQAPSAGQGLEPALPATPIKKAGYSSKPSRPPITKPAVVTPSPKNDKTGLIPGFIKQLLLWGER